MVYYNEESIKGKMLVGRGGNGRFLTMNLLYQHTMQIVDRKEKGLWRFDG